MIIAVALHHNWPAEHQRVEPGQIIVYRKRTITDLKQQNMLTTEQKRQRAIEQSRQLQSKNYLKLVESPDRINTVAKVLQFRGKRVIIIKSDSTH